MRLVLIIQRSLIFILLIIALPACAQDSHMRFMGIPIDGSIYDFDKKIEDKGFVLINEIPSDKDNLCATDVYEGVFGGFPAELYIYYDEPTEMVCQVVVWFAERSRPRLEEMYKKIKLQFKAKYQGYKQQEKTEGKTRNYILEGNDGNISMDITFSIIDYLTITYEDKANLQKLLDLAKKREKRELDAHDEAIKNDI